jgi:hypothetical protein
MKKIIKIILISVFTFIILTQSVGFVFAQDSVGDKTAFVLAQADTKSAAPSADTSGTAPSVDTKSTPPKADVRTTAPSTIFTLQNPLRSDINSIGALVQAFIEIITYIAIIFAVLAVYLGRFPICYKCSYW